MKKVSGYLFMSLYLFTNLLFTKASGEGLTIINDTKEELRVRYPSIKNKKEEKEIKLLTNEQFHYAQGTAFIYLPSRNGTYEVTIPDFFDKLKSLNFTQIMDVAKQHEHTDPYNYYTEKGEIDGIKIFFETIPFFS